MPLHLIAQSVRCYHRKVQPTSFEGIYLRLGIPVFPAPPHSVRCVCGHELAFLVIMLLAVVLFGLIKRHDALCDVILHWLLLDNPNVRREQRCSSHSMTRPGDVFHPDFSLGKAAYFDISVRNSFPPSHLINATTKAGAAAEAGEVGKDERHLVNISRYGCLFYSLVMESYGVWAAHSLEVLRSILEKSLLSSGLYLGQAFRQFHEQLSVRLWQYNSRLMSDYLPNYYDLDSCAFVLRADMCYLCYLYYIQIYGCQYIYINIKCTFVSCIQC